MSDNGIKYGVITYDVPSQKKSAYKRLRTILRGKAVMQTWSAYMFPWGIRNRLAEALEEESKESGLRFRILPYDSSASKDVEEEAEMSLRAMLEAQRKKLDKAIHEFEEEIDDDPSIPHKAIKSIRKKLDEAKMCAAAFCLSDNLIAYFAGYESVVQAVKGRLDSKMEEMKKEEKIARGEKVAEPAASDE